ncbi:MAG: CBS domain-containing protein [Thermoplasmata archaeon]
MTDKITKIMNKNPIVLKAPASRTDALKLMAKKNVSALPIVDEEDTFLGIVSRRDIFENPKEEQIALLMRKDGPKIMNTESIAEAVNSMIKINRRHIAIVNDKNKLQGIITPKEFLKIIIEENIANPIEKYIRNPCIPIYIDVPLKVVYKTMSLTKLTAFPIIDDDLNLVGIITDRDIINSAKVDVSTSMSQVGMGEDEDAWTWEGIRNVLKILYLEEKLEIPAIKVSELMIKDPVYAHTKTPISKVASIMVDNDFSQLPVKNAYDDLVAMIYDIDLISVLSQHQHYK